MREAKHLSLTTSAEALPVMSVTKDDYSIKVATSADPMFWIRLEEPYDESEVVVTDFKAGKLASHALIRGLETALGAAKLGLPRALLFKDVAPGEMGSSAGVRLIRERELIDDVCQALANNLDRSVTETRMLEERGKINVCVIFGD